MAQTKNAFLRYKILDQCLGNPGRNYTFKDLKNAINEALNEKIQNYDGLSDRQLWIDLEHLEVYYNAPIEKRISGRQRFYSYNRSTPFSIFNNPLNESEKKHLEQAILTLTQFAGRPGFEWTQKVGTFIKGDSNNQRVEPIIEYDVNLDYKGTDLIPVFFNAILNKLVLEFNYIPFNKSKLKVICHPYYLKQFNGRWFIFGRNEKMDNDQWHFPLDRIENVQTNYNLNYKVDSTESWADYFYDIIGVTRYNEPIEKVLLHVNKATLPFIQTKPIHPTQKIRIYEDEKIEIEIQVIPNHEFFSVILSYGKDLVIKEPMNLRKTMQSIVLQMANHYKQTDTDNE
ncbi:MAG: hypothetical protein RLZ10_1887 [Bacteroidota bacterium]|jgi:hypothetical protein